MSNQNVPERSPALLVGVQLPKTINKDYETSLKELERLVETLGFQIVATVTQKKSSFSPATLIGAGKVEEIAELVKGPKKVSLVVFDHELTATQLRNIKKAMGAEVLDRPAVILEIFSRHAHTKEARLQVEIARVKYLVPRERAHGRSERKGGGPGEKGLGESAHALDRRQARARISELQKELEEIHQDQATRRRHREGQPKVAIVGYTNAGKSSIMRALTSSEVLVADQLFATLDTTIRALQPEIHPRILISDTVGFIRNLPHDLVASFRSTLDEALDASLLLYVVDSSDPAFRSQLVVTREVLAGIGAEGLPSLLVLNKIDLLETWQQNALKAEFPEALLMSVFVPKDVHALRGKIIDFFVLGLPEVELVVPYDKQGVIGDIRQNVHVVREDYQEDGLHLKVKADPKMVTALKKRIAA
jgi:GTP-binding protein HflX